MKTLIIIFLSLLVLPLGAGTLWSYTQGWPQSWNTADWSATGIAPHPAKNREAIIQVYAARAGRWKGILAVHTWILIKEKNARSFERYDVVGWGRPVRRNAFPADGYWYSNAPEIILEIRGPKARKLIPQIQEAIRRYPNSNRGDYRVWPGPNSNTFVAWIARNVPELGLELPPTAVGKDFLGSGINWHTPPSGSGWQVSWNGIIGAALAPKEGLELHILGVTWGIDLQDFGIKIPALGLLSLKNLIAALPRTS